MIFDPPGNKMLATRLDCLIGSELSEPSRAEGLLGEARLVAKPDTHVIAYLRPLP